MPQVRDGRRTEGTLGALDEEALAGQLGEDDTKMTKVICPSLTIDEDVIKKTSTKRRRYGRSTSFMMDWNVAGALQRPKGMMRNSYSPSCVRNAVLCTSAARI
jgi:hypothetical protein